MPVEITGPFVEYDGSIGLIVLNNSEVVESR